MASLGSKLVNHSIFLQVVIRRGEPIPAEPDGPIIVCTRNDDLQGVVDATPPSRRSGDRMAGHFAGLNVGFPQFLLELVKVSLTALGLSNKKCWPH